MRERESRVPEYRAEQNCKRRADKDHERKEQIMLTLYFKVAEDQNIYTKEDQGKICEMKNRTQTEMKY